MKKLPQNNNNQPVTLREKYEQYMPEEFRRIPVNRRKLLDITVSVLPTQAESEYENEMIKAYLRDHPDQESLFLPYDDTPALFKAPKNSSKRSLKEFGKYTPRSQLETDYVAWRQNTELHLAYENLGLAYVSLRRRHNTNDAYEDWEIDPELRYVRYKKTTISFKGAKTRRKFLQYLFRHKRSNPNGRFYVDVAFDEFQDAMVKSHATRKRKVFNPNSLQNLFRKECRDGHFDILFECIDLESGYWFFRPPVMPTIFLDRKINRNAL